MRKLYVGLLAIFMFLSAPAVSYASSSQQLLVHTTAKDLPDSAYLKSANQQLHTHTAIEDLGNGFYGITTLEIQTAPTRASRTASKTYTLKTASGSTAASFTLTASFRYPSGVSALCTSVSHSSSISDRQWNFSAKSSSKSGNMATGNFTAKQTQSGITAQAISKRITLTCDKNGTIF